MVYFIAQFSFPPAKIISSIAFLTLTHNKKFDFKRGMTDTTPRLHIPPFKILRLTHFTNLHTTILRYINNNIILLLHFMVCEAEMISTIPIIQSDKDTLLELPTAVCDKYIADLK